MKPINIIKTLKEADQSWRSRVNEAQLKNLPENPVWVVGAVRVGQKSYRVNAKVFMEPSKFGINKGPTSKLWISSKGKTICNYDRRWDTKPKDEKEKAICDEILKYVEDFRKRNPYETD